MNRRDSRQRHIPYYEPRGHRSPRHTSEALPRDPDSASRCDELVALGHSASGAVDVGVSDWIELKQLSNQSLADSLYLDLDAGEAEAIALACELGSDLILMDERRGRKIAAHLGLTPLGLVGVLIGAKRTGVIAAVQPILDQLIAVAGFWVSADLYARALAEAQES